MGIIVFLCHRGLLYIYKPMHVIFIHMHTIYLDQVLLVGALYAPVYLGMWYLFTCTLLTAVSVWYSTLYKVHYFICTCIYILCMCLVFPHICGTLCTFIQVPLLLKALAKHYSILVQYSFVIERNLFGTVLLYLYYIFRDQYAYLSLFHKLLLRHRHLFMPLAYAYV